jgi:hypothetical protein
MPKKALQGQITASASGTFHSSLFSTRDISPHCQDTDKHASGTFVIVLLHLAFCFFKQSTYFYFVELGHAFNKHK